MSIKRIFHDPIHKEIVFDAGKPEELMIMELIINSSGFPASNTISL